VREPSPVNALEFRADNVSLDHPAAPSAQKRGYIATFVDLGKCSSSSVRFSALFSLPAPNTGPAARII
jgi:hypothetical protein